MAMPTMVVKVERWMTVSGGVGLCGFSPWSDFLRFLLTGMAPDYKYEAAYRRPDGTRQILGMFDKQASKQNADAAKDACLVHRSFTEGLANND